MFLPSSHYVVTSHRNGLRLSGTLLFAKCGALAEAEAWRIVRNATASIARQVDGISVRPTTDGEFAAIVSGAPITLVSP